MLLIALDRTKAKFFIKDSASAPLVLSEELDNPQGRLKNQELVSDSPGRSFQLGRPGLNPLPNEQEPHEHALEKFVKRLADHIVSCHERNKFDRVVVAAEPHVLGVMRKALRSRKSLPPLDEIIKDLMHCSAHELVEHLNVDLAARHAT